MKILLQNRFDMLKTGKGDRIHFFSLIDALRKKGIKVDYSLNLNPDLSDYDLVHLFNISRGDTFFQFRNAKLQKKPVVLTPLYNLTIQSKSEGFKNRMKDFLKKERNLRYLTNLIKFPLSKERRMAKNLEYDTYFLNKTAQQLFSEIDMVFPGSYAELETLLSLYKIKSKCQVVYLGVDDFFFSARGKTFVEKYGVKDFILSIVSIMPRKNPVSLIQALKGTKIPVIFVGKLGKDTQYNKKFLSSLTSNMIYLENLKYEDLVSAYAASRCHVLVSYSETTGLVNLEAGAAGTAIVCSDIPVHREYFKNYAYYCNPNSTESIRKAVLKAYKDGPLPAVRNFIREKYSWSRCAEDTINGYLEVLD